ncbi:MAG: hypothetical protein DMG80_16235 [Acidobacteria bacterium]|nr:MAG: hypothetical protein DMG80_16235 [Acidobacteriota bacterium]
MQITLQRCPESAAEQFGQKAEASAGGFVGATGASRRGCCGGIGEVELIASLFSIGARQEESAEMVRGFGHA